MISAVSDIIKIADNIFLLNGNHSSNIYFLDFDKKAVIDTGLQSDIKRKTEIFKKNNYVIDKIDYIINTHSHGDHVGGNYYLKQINPGVKIIGSKKSSDYQQSRKKIDLLKGAEDDFEDYIIDREVNEGDTIDLGNCLLHVYETPGHTRDSLSYYIEDKGIIFSGDSIYYKVVTQIDYYQDIMVSLNELINTYQKLKKINISLICPGHGHTINDIAGNLDSCFKKIKRLENQPEMILINNLIPSAEFYIYKHPGCKIHDVKDYFVTNMLKFKNEPFFIGTKENRFSEVIEKVLSLMLILGILKIDNNEKLYLINEINEYIGTKKI